MPNDEERRDANRVTAARWMANFLAKHGQTKVSDLTPKSPTVGEILMGESTDYAALPEQFQRPQIGDYFADTVQPSKYQVPPETARQIVAGLPPSTAAQPIDTSEVEKPKEKRDTPLWFKYTVGFAAVVGVTFTVLKAFGIF